MFNEKMDVKMKQKNWYFLSYPSITFLILGMPGRKDARTTEKPSIKPDQ